MTFHITSSGSLFSLCTCTYTVVVKLNLTPVVSYFHSFFVLIKIINNNLREVVTHKIAVINYNAKYIN